jgi:hypothetical protein
VSLQLLGDMELFHGHDQVDAAQARFQRAMEIDLRILGLTGPPPEALKDLSISLERLSAVEGPRGQHDLANARFQQRPEIDRKLPGFGQKDLRLVVVPKHQP